jgi:hypothetical protein
VLAPRLTATLGTLESAYLIAPYAVLAGSGGVGDERGASRGG